MFGFAFGTLCALGLVALSRRHHGYHHHGHAHRAHGCGKRQGFRRGRARRQRAPRGAVMAEMLKRRLDADEDQEMVIDHAMADVKEALKEMGATMKDARAEAADALRGDTVDQAALDALFTRTDEELARTRRHVVSAIKQVHAVLDDEQREDLADLVNGWAGQGRW